MGNCSSTCLSATAAEDTSPVSSMQFKKNPPPSNKIRKPNIVVIGSSDVARSNPLNTTYEDDSHSSNGKADSCEEDQDPFKLELVSRQPNSEMTKNNKHLVFGHHNSDMTKNNNHLVFGHHNSEMTKNFEEEIPNAPNMNSYSETPQNAIPFATPHDGEDVSMDASSPSNDDEVNEEEHMEVAGDDDQEQHDEEMDDGGDDMDEEGDVMDNEGDDDDEEGDNNKEEEDEKDEEDGEDDKDEEERTKRTNKRKKWRRAKRTQGCEERRRARLRRKTPRKAAKKDAAGKKAAAPGKKATRKKATRKKASRKKSSPPAVDPNLLPDDDEFVNPFPEEFEGQPRPVSPDTLDPALLFRCFRHNEQRNCEFINKVLGLSPDISSVKQKREVISLRNSLLAI
ncbi:MAG: hypothetical protein SGILL_005433 [Bacillariaceae sp.]